MDIALAPEFRGRGIGTGLLRDLIAEAEASGRKLLDPRGGEQPGASAVRAARLPAGRRARRLRADGARAYVNTAS